jgi:hypothetical protein
MLTSLFPGLREIRAPLAAGYLWLVAAWVAFHDDLTRHAKGSHSLAALSTLKDDVGKGGFSVALSFVAFLLGALWEPISIWFAGALWTTVRPRHSEPPPFFRYEDEKEGRMLLLLQRVLPPVWPEARRYLRKAKEKREKGRSPSEPPGSSRISREAWARLWATAGRLFADVDETAKRRLGVTNGDQTRAWGDFMRFQELVRHALGRLSDSVDSAGAGESRLRAVQLWLARQKIYTAFLLGEDEIDPKIKEMFDAEIGTDRDRWWVQEAEGVARTIDLPDKELLAVDFRPLVAAKVPHTDGIKIIEISDLVRRMIDELPLIARRLPGEQQEQFLEVTRLKAEVEFRFALAVPLVVTSSVIAAGLRLSTVAWLLVTVVAAIAGFGLLIDGWRRDRLRNDLLIELLAIGKAKSPTLERLLERAQAVERRASAKTLDEAESNDRGAT